MLALQMADTLDETTVAELVEVRLRLVRKLRSVQGIW